MALGLGRLDSACALLKWPISPFSCGVQFLGKVQVLGASPPRLYKKVFAPGRDRDLPASFLGLPLEM